MIPLDEEEEEKLFDFIFIDADKINYKSITNYLFNYCDPMVSLLLTIHYGEVKFWTTK
jgi:hypothetical protein